LKAIRSIEPKESQQQALADYARSLKELHDRWQPTESQADVGAAYFTDQILSLFIQCGRKWGKTELALYFLWRVAKTYPGVPCYYIAPLQTQAREIVWADPRVQNFGPRDWLHPGSAGINNSESRLNFKNGSFIKVDGSDNFDKYRGVKYKICVYDEYKDHRPEFRKAMRPNASVLHGLDIFMGSPPDRECDYLVIADDHRTDPKKRWFKEPTDKNPYISKLWLKEEEQAHVKRGEYDEYQREYLAEYVPGGVSKIFPMVTRDCVKPHAEVMARVKHKWKSLEWWMIADPAAASTFGVLYLAYNDFNKDIFVLDEIYESNQAEMSVSKIGQRILEKGSELNPRVDWRMVSDEAETWFKNEMLDRFRVYFEPTEKSARKKEELLSLAKDTFVHKKVTISDRCVNFFHELDNYYKDKNGKIPKKGDHLIDGYRYFLQKSHYSLTASVPHEKDEYDDWREKKTRIQDDFQGVDELGGAVINEWENLE